MVLPGVVVPDGGSVGVSVSDDRVEVGGPGKHVEAHAVTVTVENGGHPVGHPAVTVTVVVTVP